MNDAEALQRRGHVIGDYVLGEVLGIGGMGVVYAATQRSVDRRVALKVPRAELALDPAVRQRFRAEAMAGSGIEHRNIVRVIDFGDDRGVPYLVMEHVNGVSLTQLARAEHPLSVVTATDVVVQILAGLEAAHGCGVVHADVKCDNVFVETLNDGTLIPKLIDFGIARLIADHEVADPTFLITGTPDYLAPELVRGDWPTVASDIYAVGVLLYELISGTTPFAGGTTTEILARHLHDTPPPLSWRCPDRQLPLVLDELIARALAKQPAERFESAAAFGSALAPLVAMPERAEHRTPPPGAASGASSVFSTERRTVTIRGTASVVRTAGVARGHGGVAYRQQEIEAAVAAGDPDAIVVAYLQLARTCFDAHQTAKAIEELERGIELLSRRDSAAGRAPVWRLLLTLAALYDSRGDRDRAKRTTAAARDQAGLVGSIVGGQRADHLLLRLARAGGPASPSPRRR